MLVRKLRTYAHLFPSVQDEMAIALDSEWKQGFDVEDDKEVTVQDVEKEAKSNFRLIS